MFRNDYSVIAAPEVLRALSDCAGEVCPGYGTDAHTARAADLIRQTFSAPEAAVFFLSGGTQVNLAVLSYLLRPYEGVVCCDTGHINVHEAAAVEGSGHKVIAVPGEDGKLTAHALEAAVLSCPDEHTVLPRAAYISDSTETGTVYTRAELSALRAVCDRYRLYLMLDGARLGTALTSSASDITPADLAVFCDVFTVGGTKNGALAAEAAVFRDAALAEEFRRHTKNRGAMTAKGFVTAIQFEALFGDGLYFRLAAHANELAERIRGAAEAKGVKLVGTSRSNQIFLSLPTQKADEFIRDFGCEKWSDAPGSTVIRVVTSFANTEDEVEKLIARL